MHHAGSHDPALVALSVLIAILASYTALDLATRLRAAQGKVRLAWLGGAAVAMGGGIWSMHFVAILAFSLPGVAIGLDPTQTFLSFVLPIGITALGFLIVDTEKLTLPRLLFSGLIMGLGIVGMHYTGMGAMRFGGSQHHDPLWVGIATFIAITASIVALWLAFQPTSNVQRISAAVVMGFAVSGMHYSAMVGASFNLPSGGGVATGPTQVGQTPLAVWIAVTTVLILSLALVAALNDRRLAEKAEREVATLQLLEKTREALSQSQKMEAVGQLTGGIAHDFNNLLTIILGNLSIAKSTVARGEFDAERVRRAIDSADQGAQRAALLTQRLLAFSRQQPLNPQIIDVNAVFKEAAPLLERALGETCRLEIVMAAGSWNARVDPVQLEVALLNLTLNSRDAMPDGGKVTLECANAYVDEAYAARHTDLKAGQYVVVSLSDSGIGMSPDTVSRAVDPFFTTKPPGQGTGLGLSQVFGFIKQSGGHLNIYSELKQGTTVKLYLPRAYQDADQVAESPPVATPVGHGEKILVVEDDVEVSKFVAETLKDLHYQVVRANSAEKALVQFDAEKDWKVLITDVMLPGMNGRQLATKIFERAPQVKIIFMTGYSRNAIVHQGRLDPGVVLLQKPFTREALALRVHLSLASSNS